MLLLVKEIWYLHVHSADDITREIFYKKGNISCITFTLVLNVKTKIKVLFELFEEQQRLGFVMNELKAECKSVNIKK